MLFPAVIKGDHCTKLSCIALMSNRTVVTSHSGAVNMGLRIAVGVQLGFGGVAVVIRVVSIVAIVATRIAQVIMLVSGTAGSVMSGKTSWRAMTRA